MDFHLVALFPSHEGLTEWRLVRYFPAGRIDLVRTDDFEGEFLVAEFHGQLGSHPYFRSFGIGIGQDGITQKRLQLHDTILVLILLTLRLTILGILGQVALLLRLFDRLSDRDTGRRLPFLKFGFQLLQSFFSVNPRHVFLLIK